MGNKPGRDEGILYKVEKNKRLKVTKMKEILCSTGALLGRANNRNHNLLDELARKLTCDGFELMLYPAWYENIDNIVSDIKRMSLHIPVMHCDKNIGDMISSCNENHIEDLSSAFEINCQVASDLKISKVVLHLWGGMASDQNIEKNISIYKVLNSIAQKYGTTLMIENVVCNKDEPMQHLLELYEAYPYIAFTFDTKMAAFHDQIDKIYDKEWRWLWDGKHIEHLHINDYNGGYKDWQNLKTLHIGDGKVDFDTFFEFLHRVGYSEDFTIESTSFNQSGEVDCEKLNNSISIIKDYLRSV